MTSEMVFTNGRPVAEVYDELVARVTARGARPYVLPPGGSTGIGIVGFVAAVGEVHRQPTYSTLRRWGLEAPFPRHI